MTLYKIDNIRRVHGARTVLNIETLSIEQGKVYTLTGPNGAGKTTLLNILAFLDKPSSGNIDFLGERVRWSENDLHRMRRYVVLLDQNPIMFSGTVEDNVAFGLKMRKMARAEIGQRVAKVLDLVGLARFAGQNAQKLSGGETKRVALARALAVQPEVLICDEPSANVDNENQEMILDLLARINQEQGTSIIFSTHYLAQGYRLADHTLLLENGSLSDILNENVYRSRIVSRNGNEGICQLAEQLFMTSCIEALPEQAEQIKLWVDPETVAFGCVEPGAVGDTVLENCFAGTLIEISHQQGLIKLCVDIGVRLVLYTSYETYEKIAPLVGARLNITVPKSSIRCTLL